MKYLASMIFVALLGLTPLLAQKTITTDVEMTEMSQGEQPAIIVDIPQVEVDHLKKEWKRWLKKGSRVDLEEEGKEVYAIGVTRENISKKPMTVYGLFQPLAKGVRMYAFFEIDSVFINPKDDEITFSAANRYIRDFAVEQYRECVKKDLEEARDELHDLENDLDGLYKDYDKLVKNIDKAKHQIENYKDEINELEGDEQRLDNQIAAQKSLLVTLKDATDDEIKTAEKELKSLEKDRDKVQKNIDKLHSKISDEEADIREWEREKTENKKDQSLKNVEITEQAGAVQAYEFKLENIK